MISALLGATGDEVLRATGTARLEDHVVVLRAEVDLSGCGGHRISSEFDKLGWSGRDFLSGYSEREQAMKYQPARSSVIRVRKIRSFCPHPTLACTPSS